MIDKFMQGSGPRDNVYNSFRTLLRINPSLQLSVCTIDHDPLDLFFKLLGVVGINWTPTLFTSIIYISYLFKLKNHAICKNVIGSVSPKVLTSIAP